jgi:cytochrome c oxidase subunit 2
VGRPVIAHLPSKDVIHSFGLPQMRVKQDAIPGIEQRLWFMPTKTGEWAKKSGAPGAVPRYWRID